MNHVDKITEKLEFDFKTVSIIKIIKKQFSECEWKYNKRGNCYEGSNGWIIRSCYMGVNEDMYFKQFFIYKEDESYPIYFL